MSKQVTNPHTGITYNVTARHADELRSGDRIIYRGRVHRVEKNMPARNGGGTMKLGGLKGWSWRTYDCGKGFAVLTRA